MTDAELRAMLEEATPGPWEWRDTEEGFYCSIYGADEKFVISPALHFDGRDEDGEADYHGYTEVRNEADACLIAAAPELAEEVLRLREALEAFELWRATNVARARGLAESMSELPTEVRPEGVEENCAEIVKLLAARDAAKGGGG